MALRRGRCCIVSLRDEHTFTSVLTNERYSVLRQLEHFVCRAKNLLHHGAVVLQKLKCPTDIMAHQEMEKILLNCLNALKFHYCKGLR
jgi:hypothetical protein